MTHAQNTDQEFPHEPSCKSPKVRWEEARRGVGWFGRCYACGLIQRRRDLPVDAVMASNPSELPFVRAAPAPLPASTRYVCRDHTDQFVSWRGKGCAKCARDRAERSR